MDGGNGRIKDNTTTAGSNLPAVLKTLRTRSAGGLELPAGAHLACDRMITLAGIGDQGDAQ